MRVTEYIVIVRETARISEFYRAVGVIQPLIAGQTPFRDAGEQLVFRSNQLLPTTMPYLKPVHLSEAADIIAGSAFVDFMDVSHITSGTIDGVFNIAFGGRADWRDPDVRTFNMSTAWLFPTSFSDFVLAGYVMDIAWLDNARVYYIRIRTDRVEAGFPEWVGAEHGSAQGFWLDVPQGDPRAAIFYELEIGDRVLLRSSIQVTRQRWFLTRHHSDAGILPLNGFWYDEWIAPYDFEPIYIVRLPNEPGAPIDYTALGLADAEPHIRLFRQNQQAVGVIATMDMTAMPGVVGRTGNISAAEGRLLTLHDYQAANNVVVINRVFAGTRGISVGDVLAVDLRNLSNPFQHGVAFPADDPDWLEMGTYRLELEVVGLFTGGAGSANDIFIPASLLPQGYGHINTVSLTLLDIAYEDSFREEYRDALAAIGFSVLFLDTDAAVFLASVEPMMFNAMINTVVFSSVLIMALILVAFVYTRARRREISILRALGMPKAALVCKAVTALCLVCVFGIAGGGVGAFNFALSQAEQTLSGLHLLEGMEASSDLSVLWLSLICAAILALVAVITLVGINLRLRKPVLELLQDNTVKVKNVKVIDSGEVIAVPDKIDLGDPVAAGPNAKKHARAARRLFVFRHMRRSSVKSALTLVIAAAFVIALGYIYTAIQRNTAEIERLYDTTIVTTNFMQADADEVALGIFGEGDGGLILGTASNFIPPHIPTFLKENEFIVDTYLEMRQEQVGFSAVTTPMHRSEFDLRVFSSVGGLTFFETDWEFMDAAIPMRMAGINMLHQFLSGFGDAADLAVEFAYGFDESIFDIVILPNAPLLAAFPVIIPRDMAYDLGVSLGDEILLLERYFDGLELWGGRRLSSYPNGGSYNVYSAAIVAGIYYCRNTGGDVEDFINPILMPLSVMINRHNRIFMLGPSMPYASFHFYSAVTGFVDPAKNRELDDLAAAMHEIAAAIPAIDSGFFFNFVPRTVIRGIVNDGELRQVVEPLEQNLRLMQVLYPLTIVLSALTGTGLAAIIMLQNAKNAALLRILGSPKRTSRGVLCVEQVILCFVGVIIGLLALGIINADITAVWNVNTLLCATLYVFGVSLGSVCGSVSITSKMPLELLQVRE